MKREEKRYYKEVFYTITVAFAIVLFWRGIWGLLDLYLFPENKVISYLLSVIFGILILYKTENILERLV
jgi:hypothetical protein